jgi:hypothetical protein
VLEEPDLEEASKIYKAAVSELSDSSLVCVLYAQFLMYAINAPLLARRALLLAESRKPSLDERFIIFKCMKHLEENAFQQEDIIGFVTGEKHLHLSKAYDKQCCVLLAEFWECMSEAKINVSRIRSLADQIAEYASLASASYTKLLKLRPTDAALLELYSGFVGTIGNDPDEGVKLKSKALEMRSRQAKTKQSTLDKDLRVDANSGILTVDASGEEDTGNIVAANMQAGRSFFCNIFLLPALFLICRLS